jgi:NitT/TauT family transport system substrate-binding protein
MKSLVIAQPAAFLVCLALLASATKPSRAQDKAAVGAFPLSSSLPYFVALGKSFFKEFNIEAEMTTLMGGPANVGLRNF